MIRLVLAPIAALLPMFALVNTLTAQPLAKADLLKRGKAATAIVQFHPAYINGTAFCVHPAGYFLTSERAYFGKTDDAPAALVLDPGLKSQRILKAHLVRRDKELGIALLRAENVKDLPALTFGAVDSLTELTELITFHFESGAIPFKDQPEYPSATVSATTVTSLMQKDGELSLIHLKGVPSLGVLGCPVLDDKARVVGMLNIGGGKVGKAMPVNRLARFLATPDIVLTPPLLSRANLDKSAEFQARITALIPSVKPVQVELALTAGAAPKRGVPMLLKDGIYRAALPPGLVEIAPRVELTAHFGSGGTVTGMVEDRAILIGKDKIKLSDCQRIQGSRAVLTNGKSLDGELRGLDAVEFEIGAQFYTFNLQRAASVLVVKPRPLAEVTCTIFVKQDDKVIARLVKRLPIRSAALYEPADLSKIAIRPPKLDGDKVVKNLPEMASDICVGGGGRFLILHLPKLKKLAIFDVNAANIVRYIDLKEDKASFAAGLDKLVIAYPTKGSLERWNLLTGEQEFARTQPDLSHVVMGSASQGPIATNRGFFDLLTLLPVPILTPRGLPSATSPVSADGTVFGAWKTNQSPGTSISFVLTGNELKRFEEGDHGHVAPGPDGRQLFTKRGVLSSQLTGLSHITYDQGYCLPSSEPNFYLSLTSDKVPTGNALSVYLLGVKEPILKDAKFDHGIRFDGWDRESFGPWKRVFFIPQAKLIVFFPHGNDRLELRRLDVDDLLDKSDIDYMYVTSPSTALARRGTVFSFGLTARSRRGASFGRRSSPEGLEITPAGAMEWHVPQDFRDDMVSLVAILSDGRREVFHTMTIRIID